MAQFIERDEDYAPKKHNPPRQKVVLAPVPATIQLKVHCGCGATFDNIDEGAAHTAHTAHTLTINGEIRAKY